MTSQRGTQLSGCRPDIIGMFGPIFTWHDLPADAGVLELDQGRDELGLRLVVPGSPGGRVGRAIIGSLRGSFFLWDSCSTR